MRLASYDCANVIFAFKQIQSLDIGLDLITE